MNIGAIEDALGLHLEALPGVPTITWANKSASPDKPYLTTLHAPVSQINPTLDGSTPTDNVGLWLVTVVVDGDTFTTEANSIAEDVKNHFRQGARIDATGGTVIVVDRVAIVGGFHDQANNWNVPVRVTYRTET